MASFIKSYEKKPRITCDFWFFAVIAAAVYFGGDALCLLLAALVHEAGHWIALVATNNGVLQLRLRGCCAHIVPYYRRLPGLRQELLILAAGPLAGVLFALILKPLAPRFAKISLLLSIFNLLPVRGLDGGSMLRLLYAAVFNTEKMQVPNAIGALVAVLVLVAGIGSFFENRPNIPLLGVAVFLILKQFILVVGAD
ncbi:site-2 protease family protein [Oscillospiraceae bacterium LTW-04]|nr:site-2 protease family protein [Oscillospiraceae bacterium MB24-C1]